MSDGVSLDGVVSAKQNFAVPLFAVLGLHSGFPLAAETQKSKNGQSPRTGATTGTGHGTHSMSKWACELLTTSTFIPCLHLCYHSTRTQDQEMFPMVLARNAKLACDSISCVLNDVAHERNCLNGHQRRSCIARSGEAAQNTVSAIVTGYPRQKVPIFTLLAASSRACEEREDRTYRPHSEATATTIVLHGNEGPLALY